MQKLSTIILFSVLVTACTTVYTGESYPPDAVEIPEDYTPKSSDISQLRIDMVSTAKKYIGSKYKYAGTTPKGFDCSGFTSYVYDQSDLYIPRSSSGQASEGAKIALRDSKPGDLLFFTGTGRGKITHVALIVENSRDGIEVIHSTTSRGVIRENISNSRYWKPKILYAKNMID